MALVPRVYHPPRLCCPLFRFGIEQSWWLKDFLGHRSRFQSKKRRALMNQLYWRSKEPAVLTVGSWTKNHL